MEALTANSVADVSSTEFGYLDTAALTQDAKQDKVPSTLQWYMRYNSMFMELDVNLFDLDQLGSTNSWYHIEPIQ